MLPIVKFRNCFLNLTERRLIRDGVDVKLTPKNFDVLMLLVRKAGEVVTKDEILGHVWNGELVEESNVNVRISAIRLALDPTRQIRFIETVQNSGFRFIAPIEEITVEDWELIANHARFLDSPNSESAMVSIAVLPFHIESDQSSHSYISIGISEDLINQLSIEEGLQVASRVTSFRLSNTEVNPKIVGNDLGVSLLLTGRIRIVADRTFTSVELTTTSDGMQIWGTRLESEFEDTANLAGRIFELAITRIRQWSGACVVPKGVTVPPISPKAWREFYKGRFAASKRTRSDLNKAIGYFSKSVAIDPSNRLAYVEIVEANLALYFSDEISYLQVKDRIEPYLKIINSLAEFNEATYSMMGFIKTYLDWDFEGAIVDFENAISLNPSFLPSRYRYANTLVQVGRFADVIREIDKVSQLDPLSFASAKWIGRLFYKMGLFESAISHLQDAVEIAPHDYIALGILGSALIEAGNHEEGVSCIERSLKLHYNSDIFAMLGHGFAKQGDSDRALEIVQKLRRLPTDTCQPRLKLARIFLALGDEAETFRLIDEAIDLHDSDVADLNSDPRWSDIKGTSDFRKRLLRVGLIQENKTFQG